MIQGKIISYGGDLKEVYKIRKSVFVDELNSSVENEFDILDNDSVHVLVYEEIKSDEGEIERIPVATGRIEYDGEVCNINHIAVVKDFRNMLYGDFTVRMLLNRAFISGIDVVNVISPENLRGFFTKIGFKILNEFTDESNKIFYHMSVMPNDLNKKCNNSK